MHTMHIMRTMHIMHTMPITNTMHTMHTKPLYSDVTMRARRNMYVQSERLRLMLLNLHVVVAFATHTAEKLQGYCVTNRNINIAFKKKLRRHFICKCFVMVTVRLGLGRLGQGLAGARAGWGTGWLGHGNSAVRVLDCQSGGPMFESTCRRFETSISFTPIYACVFLKIH